MVIPIVEIRQVKRLAANARAAAPKGRGRGRARGRARGGNMNLLKKKGLAEKEGDRVQEVASLVAVEFCTWLGSGGCRSVDDACLRYHVHVMCCCLAFHALHRAEGLGP